MFDQEMIGAIKIKDGLFIGDELASQVTTHQKNLYKYIIIKLSKSLHNNFINVTIK